MNTGYGGSRHGKGTNPVGGITYTAIGSTGEILRVLEKMYPRHELKFVMPDDRCFPPHWRLEVDAQGRLVLQDRSGRYISVDCRIDGHTCATERLYICKEGVYEFLVMERTSQGVLSKKYKELRAITG